MVKLGEQKKTSYTISIRADIYERLLRRKKEPDDSFSEIIKRLLDKDTPGGKHVNDE